MIVDHSRIGAAFRRLSIPVAIQILGDQLLGTVDTIAIGSLGFVALAGATAANTIFVAIVFVASGFLSGTSLVAAQRIGAGDVDGFARTVRAGVALPMLVGVICFAASLFGARSVDSRAGRLAAQRPPECDLSNPALRLDSADRDLGVADRRLGRGRKSTARHLGAGRRQRHSHSAAADAWSGLVDASSVRYRRRRRFVAAFGDDRRGLRALLHGAPSGVSHLRQPRFFTATGTAHRLARSPRSDLSTRCNAYPTS